MKRRILCIFLLFFMCFSSVTSAHADSANSSVYMSIAPYMAASAVALGYTFQNASAVQGVLSDMYDYFSQNVPSILEKFRSWADSKKKYIPLDSDVVSAVSSYTSARSDALQSGFSHSTTSYDSVFSFSSNFPTQYTYPSAYTWYGTSDFNSLFSSAFPGTVYRFSVSYSLTPSRSENYRIRMRYFPKGYSSAMTAFDVSVNSPTCSAGVTYTGTIYFFFRSVVGGVQLSSDGVTWSSVCQLPFQAFEVAPYQSSSFSLAYNHSISFEQVRTDTVSVSAGSVLVPSADQIQQCATTLGTDMVKVYDTPESYVGTTSATLERVAEGMVGLVSEFGVVGEGIAQLVTAVQNFFDLSRPVDFSPIQNVGSLFSQKFPFSLPWDLKRMADSLSVMDDSKPIYEGKILDHDFSISIPDMFLPYISFLRQMVLLSFVVGLILLTPHVMGGEK